MASRQDEGKIEKLKVKRLCIQDLGNCSPATLVRFYIPKSAQVGTSSARGNRIPGIKVLTLQKGSLVTVALITLSQNPNNSKLFQTPKPSPQILSFSPVFTFAG
ncbi:hypothetical protein QAD02_016347 [Eretmocerus hayati]|uniref:Uncharacterized protein n=1 Tax=Eretmocerus hayati TaxID=131215 RepID=A0ACC2PAC2_9HYME|nr:hypothetical protein QAD02_016347 [Eretmocerus hayati]